MPEVQLEAGERKEIVSPDNVEVDTEYYIRVQGGAIRLAKRKRFLGTSKGIKLPDTTGIPVTPERDSIGSKDGIYAKNVSEEPVTIEWQKTGLKFGVISLGQQATNDTEVSRLFERDNGVDVENGDSIQIDLTNVSRHELEVALKDFDTAVDIDINVSNTGEFSGEEFTAYTITSGDYNANESFVKGFDVNTFRFIEADVKGSGNANDSGVLELSGAR